MRLEAIRKVKDTTPFRPFKIVTASGQRYDVGHPEMILIPPEGDAVVVADRAGGFNIVDTELITELSVPKGRAKK